MGLACRAGSRRTGRSANARHWFPLASTTRRRPCVPVECSRLLLHGVSDVAEDPLPQAFVDLHKLFVTRPVEAAVVAHAVLVLGVLGGVLLGHHCGGLASCRAESGRRALWWWPRTPADGSRRPHPWPGSFMAWSMAASSSAFDR